MRVFILALVMSVQGLTAVPKQRFDLVLQRLEEMFSPLFQERKRKLVFIAHWDIDVVNAYATQVEDSDVILILGGLAQHPLASEGSLILALCHELGHFLGGPPYHSDPDLSSLSVEGQADYFASAFCMKAYYHHYPPPEQVLFPSSREAKELCRQKLPSPDNADDQKKEEQICLHTLQAALSGLQSLYPPNGAQYALSTPFQHQGSEITKEGYTSPQCRLDTFVAGALCNRSVEHISFSTIEDSYCQIGPHERPPCWFSRQLH